MDRMPSIHGSELTNFLETFGCNKRNQIGEHSVFWSVATGDFFVVPTYPESLDSSTIRHIIWQIGITNESFINMWNEYSNNKGQITS